MGGLLSTPNTNLQANWYCQATWMEGLLSTPICLQVCWQRKESRFTKTSSLVSTRLPNNRKLNLSNPILRNSHQKWFLILVLLLEWQPCGPKSMSMCLSYSLVAFQISEFFFSKFSFKCSSLKKLQRSEFFFKYWSHYYVWGLKSREGTYQRKEGSLYLFFKIS